MSCLEHFCLSELFEKTIYNPNTVVAHLEWCLNKSFTTVNTIFNTLKKVSPLFKKDNSSASALFLNLACAPREYFNCALQVAIQNYLRRQEYIFSAQQRSLNIPWEDIDKNFKNKCEEVEKAFSEVFLLC